MSRFCQNCGAPLSPDSVFCLSCGRRYREEGQSEVLDKSALSSLTGKQPDKQVEKQTDVLPEIQPDKQVEVQPGTLLDLQPDNRRQPGPVKFIAASIRRGTTSMVSYFRNPRKMIPILVLAVVWLVLSVLPAMGINPLPVKILSFVTFAQGGMYGGFWGAAGGILGKAVFAWFFSALLIPLVTGKVSGKGFGAGMKQFFAGFYIQGLGVLAALLAGIGLALIIFNFLSGNASIINSMPGIVGIIMAIRIGFRRSGFFWGLMLSFANKKSKGKIPTNMTINHMAAGYATGSLTGVALSAVSVPYLPYLAGAIFIVISIVISIAAKARKEAIPV